MYSVGGANAPLTENSGAAAVYFNTTYTSVDGQTWVTQSSNQYSARTDPTCVADTSNNVYVIGGATTTYVQTPGPYYHPIGTSEVWKSSNNGASWSLQPTTAMFPIRYSAVSVNLNVTAFNKNVMVVASGCYWSMAGGNEMAYNDVWASSDSGLTWAAITQSAMWAQRCQAAMVVSSTGAMVIAGGRTAPAYNNVNLDDTYISLDGGYTWNALATQAVWSVRSGLSLILDENEYMYVVAGASSVYWATDADMYVSSLPLRNASSWLPSVISTYALPSSQRGCVGLVCWPTVDGTQDCEAAAYCTSGPPSSAATWTFTLTAQSPPWSGRESAGLFTTQVPITYPGGTAPTGSLVMMGGIVGQSGVSDSWVSTPVNGAVGGQWVQITGNNTFAAYQSAGSAYGMDKTGRFYVIGGALSPLPLNNLPSVTYFNTTWTSANAQTWTAYSNTTGQQYTARTGPAVVVDSSNNVYVIGGGWTTFVQTGTPSYYHPYGCAEVWKSSNNGATFSLVAANASFAPRYSASAVITASKALSTNVITLAAGCNFGNDEFGMNDVLYSTNSGQSFVMLTANAPWSARCQAAMAQSAAGALILMGGRSAPAYAAVEDSDAWISLDGGYSWVNIQSSGAWSARVGPAIALDSSERVILLGGAAGVYWAADATVYTSSLSLTSVKTWIGPVTQALTGTAYALPATQSGCVGLVCIPTSTTPNCAAAAQCSSGGGTTGGNTGGTTTSSGGGGGGGGGSGLSGGAIAGIVIGCAVAVHHCLLNHRLLLLHVGREEDGLVQRNGRPGTSARSQ